MHLDICHTTLSQSFHVNQFTCIQTDLEEAKAQELSKLQSSMEALQAKLDDTNAMLVKEREAAKKAIEEAPPVVKETELLVQDTEKVDSLTAEVEELKVHKYIIYYFCCWPEFPNVLLIQ